MTRRRLQRRPQRGFTLLEVILTLTISTILIAAVTGAIATYLRVSEVGRAEVERAQLARTLLRRIADDLRSTVPMPSDTPSASLTADAATLAANLSGSGGVTSTAGAAQAATDAVATADTASTVTSAPAAARGAVFYGTQYELQFQISRLPPLTASLLNSTSATNSLAISSDSLSDVKQVSYFLQSAASQAGAQVTTFATDGAVPTAAGGLVRQESSQVAADFAASQGGATTAALEPPTPEVAALEFRYFDGMEWLYDWDSSVTGALPQAVEITLVLRSASTNDPLAALDSFAATTSSATTAVLPDDRYYRLVVHLPAAVPNYSALGVTSGTSSSSSTETTP